MNHRWHADKCMTCGLTRERRTRSLTMAITDQPPYNHMKHERLWWYGPVHKFTRPDCKRIINNQK